MLCKFDRVLLYFLLPHASIMNSTKGAEGRLHFLLYACWEALIVGKRLPQGQLTICTPSKSSYEKCFWHILAA